MNGVVQVIQGDVVIQVNLAVVKFSMNQSEERVTKRGATIQADLVIVV